MQHQQPQMNFNPLMLMMMCQQMKSMMSGMGGQQVQQMNPFNFKDNCMKDATENQWPQQFMYPHQQMALNQARTANYFQLQTPLKPKTVLSVDDSPQDSPILTVESDESTSLKSEPQQFSQTLPRKDEERPSLLGSSEKLETSTRIGDSLQHTASKKEAEILFSQKSVVTKETLSDDDKRNDAVCDKNLGLLWNSYTDIDIHRYDTQKPLNN
jgi:hypothetical protein